MLFSGGPASGGNLVHYAAVQRATDHDLTVVAFPNGYTQLVKSVPPELLEARLITIDRERVRYLRDQNGLVFGTARANPGKQIRTVDDLNDPEKTKPLTYILDVFEALRIGALVSVGGDDTMRTANLLQTHYERLQAAGRSFENFRGVVHVPKTIDKDYLGIDFTFGFMTAAETFGDKVLGLHNDAKATGTAEAPVIHVVEIMGRAAGWLCGAASIYGQATYAIVPEDYAGRETVSLGELAQKCADVILTRRDQGKHYSVITIAEGLGDLLPRVEAAKDEFGHTRLDEVDLGAQLKRAILDELAKRVQKVSTTFSVKPKVVAHKAGYEGRQVKPSMFDTLLCQRLGVSAIDAILLGKFGHMVSVFGVFSPRYVPFGDLVDPTTLKVKNWQMTPDEGLHQLLKARQQPFRLNVEFKP